MNVSPTVKGRGVMPDYEVRQSWEDYLKEGNTKKNFVLEEIIGKNQDQVAQDKNLNRKDD